MDVRVLYSQIMWQRITAGWPVSRVRRDGTLKLYSMLRCLASALLDESGQDLIEYAIIAALISLAAIAGMRSVATAISVAFTNNANRFSSAIS